MYDKENVYVIHLCGFAGSKYDYYGKLLAHKLGFLYLDKDHASKSFVDTILTYTTGTDSDRESKVYRKKVNLLEYETLKYLIRENINNGISVVVSAPGLEQILKANKKNDIENTKVKRSNSEYIDLLNVGNIASNNYNVIVLTLFFNSTDDIEKENIDNRRANRDENKRLFWDDYSHMKKKVHKKLQYYSFQSTSNFHIVNDFNEFDQSIDQIKSVEDFMKIRINNREIYKQKKLRINRLYLMRNKNTMTNQIEQNKQIRVNFYLGFKESKFKEFARAASIKSRYGLLDKDTISRNFVEAIMEKITGDKLDRDSEFYQENINRYEYKVLCKMLEENIKIGNSVIVVAPFLRQIINGELKKYIKDIEKRFNVIVEVKWITYNYRIFVGKYYEYSKIVVENLDLINNTKYDRVDIEDFYTIYKTNEEVDLNDE